MKEFLDAFFSQSTGYYVGWFTLALIIAGIAQGKNRDGLGWFFLGILFGPLGLFFLVLADKLKAKEGPK
jgi:biotin transporter BioY